MSNSLQFQMFHAPCNLPGEIVQLFRVYSSARRKGFQKTAVVVGYDVGGRRMRRTVTKPNGPFIIQGCFTQHKIYYDAV